MNGVELVHGFLNLSKVVLPLMEAKIIESNNLFEAFKHDSLNNFSLHQWKDHF